MATAFSYTTKTALPDLVAVFASVGAHLAAKLQAFDSDERTLTDELCDMSYIWAVSPRRSKTKASSLLLPNTPLRISFGKTTVPEESVNGADLKLVITTPSGCKSALFQAKVVETTARRLRRNSPNDWAKLESQLHSMQSRVGETAFLLVYVPAHQLNGRNHGYGTWEQGFVRVRSSKVSSRFGATVIPARDLIDAAGKWKNATKVQNISKGRFSPTGFSFARLMLEIVSCARGQYSAQGGLQDDFRDFRELSIGIEANANEWDDAINATRRVLHETSEPFEDDDGDEGLG